MEPDVPSVHLQREPGDPRRWMACDFSVVARQECRNGSAGTVFNEPQRLSMRWGGEDLQVVEPVELFCFQAEFGQAADDGRFAVHIDGGGRRDERFGRRIELVRTERIV